MDAVLPGTPGGSPGDWTRVLGRMRREVGETAYRSWFGSMTVERIAGGEGVIAVPTRFLRDWVTTHYADRLLALTQEPEVKEQLLKNTEATVARGTFGSPTFFVGEEIFFGKDKLGDVEEEIVRATTQQVSTSKP